MQGYTITGRIGEGAHGLVLRGIHCESGKEVALKRIMMKKIDDEIPVSIIREIKSLQELNHPYIIKLLDAFPSGYDFIMIFDYMPSGLWELLRDNDRPLTVPQIKIYFKMLLEGTRYMHKNNFMHRDLKPANLLINNDGILKIADFGLTRLMYDDSTHPYSHQVATRWYRAPELLYGSKIYTSAIDMWSVGCIFAEMINSSPLFPGETDIEQLAIVLKQLGSPTPESWPELTSLPDYNKITFPYQTSIPWEQIVPEASSEALDIIRSLLIYNSSKRLTAEEILKHNYFYVSPFPCDVKQLSKPTYNHRNQFKTEEIDCNIKSTELFADLIKIM
ncbi:cyclin-dependent kinase 20 isoform X1 [Microplitis demolitor]|uniref:cyclin-dependent kinase 20 isoform X1 n=2 Tax=Microplitis demolitor TaxID=69319 RepID=UPI0004CDCD8F|nr:cyclin-dependent kinase 20 isoform X1 [Microplitis demolitor]